MECPYKLRTRVSRNFLDGSRMVAGDRPVNDAHVWANRLIQLARRGGFLPAPPQSRDACRVLSLHKQFGGDRHLPPSTVYSKHGFSLTPKRTFVSAHEIKRDGKCFRPGAEVKENGHLRSFPRWYAVKHSPGWRGWRFLTECCGCFFL